jgi:NAD+ kinase
MPFPVRRCALIGPFSDARVLESAQSISAHLQQRRVVVLVSQEAGELPALTGITRVTESALASQADLVIAIGGDGTLLQAAGLVARHDVPLLGINRGRLGFLTDVMPQDVMTYLDAALNGELERDMRPLLFARLQRPGQAVVECLALNDVVVQRMGTGRLLDFETSVNGRYVNTHSGDGMIIASATGSTAYALSCGGPIVEPNLDVMVLSPICPHTLSDRPIVVSARTTIEIQLLERGDTRARFVCDGQVRGEMTCADRLQIAPAKERITLLHPPGYDYFSLLRSKLHWGRRSVEPVR